MRSFAGPASGPARGPTASRYALAPHPRPLVSYPGPTLARIFFDSSSTLCPTLVCRSVGRRRRASIVDRGERRFSPASPLVLVWIRPRAPAPQDGRLRDAVQGLHRWAAESAKYPKLRHVWLWGSGSKVTAAGSPINAKSKDTSGAAAGRRPIRLATGLVWRRAIAAPRLPIQPVLVAAAATGLVRFRALRHPGRSPSPATARGVHCSNPSARANAG